VDVLEVERAVVELEQLLEENPDDEAKYQALFESYPVILDVLGYRERLQRPRLRKRDGGYFEPDFLAVRSSRLWEVVDLKTPGEEPLLGLTRRERFSARFQSYLSQVHEYDEYFDDFEHRKSTLERFGADVQRRPDKVLISGRDADTDKRQVHHQLTRLASHVTVLTYDDVLSALVQAHGVLTGEEATTDSGLSMFLHLAFDNPLDDRRGYVFDFVGDRGNRLSLYMNERRRLVLEVTMDDGEVLALPINVPAHNSSEPILVNVEAGVRGTRGVMQVRIDDSIVGQLNLTGNDVRRAMGFSRATLGTDVDYTSGGWFGLLDWVIYPNLIGFRDRLKLVEYFMWKRETADGIVIFGGEQGMDMQNLGGNSFRPE
jgi:Shedu protein SduA, C-terminal